MKNRARTNLERKFFYCLGIGTLTLGIGCSDDTPNQVDASTGWQDAFVQKDTARNDAKDGNQVDANLQIQDANLSSLDASGDSQFLTDGSMADGTTVVIPPNLSTETVTFPSSDGVLITADLYMQHPANAPFILLAHRADWSRGEYLEIAPRLNAMGFNAMAIDLRSGKQKFDVVNATQLAAKAAGKPTLYLDALIDLQSSLEYAKAKLAKGPLLVWGSSFSASLTLMLAKANPTAISALICFAPGEYFAGQYGKTNTSVREAAVGIALPAFFTSKKSEYDDSRKAIFTVLASEKKTYFVPETEGKHGSEALFSTTLENAAYWAALTSFLDPWIP